MKTLCAFFIMAAVGTALPVHAASKDLRGKDLSRQELKNENFDRADLSDANLQGASLKNATLKGANLKGADLTSADLQMADLSEADLRKAKLVKTSFENAKLIRANLEGNEVFFAYGNAFDEEGSKRAVRALQNASAPLSVMKERNGSLTLKEANLKNATLHGELDGIDFRRADLRGANLQNTKNLQNAIFRGAIYDSNTHWPESFDLQKAGVVKGEEYDAVASNAKEALKFAWTRRWLIKPEEGGATEKGSLTIKEDGTYEWFVSVSAEPLVGKWKASDMPAKEGEPGNIILQKGEGGHDWVAGKATKHADRPDSIELKAADADLFRWGLPVN